LVIVLDALKIQRVVCLGEGSGANIAARFAIKNPKRCSGVVLIHPTGSSASFMEQFKEKILNKFPNLINHSGLISEWHENYLIWHRYTHGTIKENEDLLKANIREFLAKLYAERNPKNLSLLVDAYLK
jgi:pimeloyl-ACP methyl ester carboxylesterase